MSGRTCSTASADADSWVAMQFDNPANTEIHRSTTAREIINDFPDGLDYLITGVDKRGQINEKKQIHKRKK